MSAGSGSTTGWLSALVLLLLILLDLLTPGENVALSPLFALSPLIACTSLTWRRTGLFAIAAVVAALFAGLWNDDGGTAQHIVRVIDVTVMSGAAVVVASVRTRQERKVQRLSALADVAQRAVLPVLPRHARRTDIAVRYQSAARDTVMGGDLYDCYHSRTHTRFLLGDVRGKGIEAVEQAARVIRAFRQAAAIQSDLKSVAEDMSNYLVPFFGPEEFVTAVLVDTTEAGRIRIVNAGHPPPLLIHPDGSCEFVETEADLPLGLGWSFAQHQVDWSPGDRLLLYTDGVSEARDLRGEFLDLASLAPLLAGGPLDDALERLLDRVRTYSVRGELADDVAVMLLEHTVIAQEDPPMAQEHDWLALLR